MAALGERVIQAGDGISEFEWQASPQLAALPQASWQDWAAPEGRVFVVAPHPDDEVLAAGGLMAQLAAAGHDVQVVAVTDGGASHPGSRLWPQARLLEQRPRESGAALRCLGVRSACLRLHLPDGAIAVHRATLVRRLCQLFAPGDRVVTTWRWDGHPDHEETAQAVAEAAARRHVRLFEAPVWAWHWCLPSDERWPWSRARRLPLDLATRERKQRAVQAHASQLHPDPSTGRGPVLRPSIVARAARPFEVFFAHDG
ncbi:PIG-L family deacetylase [Variovorax dokdonensis]|uniref:PIG-L family deacetylase n=1 Tax=Variovorax dokdonensis TaxID=344883 RepID=A0ABT7NGU4_9BURK|nr:PIG-L family deacetylase [Variovorax dokdonensis]MDM0047164.1 PIG-L family deacetylase [Variovorax dokdonensis]